MGEFLLPELEVDAGENLPWEDDIVYFRRKLVIVHAWKLPHDFDLTVGLSRHVWRPEWVLIYLYGIALPIEFRLGLQNSPEAALAKALKHLVTMYFVQF